MVSSDEKLFLKTRQISVHSAPEISNGSDISIQSSHSVDRAITRVGLDHAAAVGSNIFHLSRASMSSLSPEHSPGNNKHTVQESGAAPTFGQRKTFKVLPSEDSFEKDDYKSKAKYNDSGISSPTSSLSSVPAREMLDWKEKQDEVDPAMTKVEVSVPQSFRPKLQRDSTIMSSTEVETEPDLTDIPNIQPSMVHVMVGHRELVTQCFLTNDYVISSSTDCTIRVWDVSTGCKLKVMRLQKAIYDFEYIVHNSGDSVLFAGCEDGKIFSFKILQAGELICKLVGEYAGHLPNPVRAMTYSPDLKHLATGCCFLMKQIIDGRIQTTPVIRGTLKIFDLESMVADALRNDGYYTDKGPLVFKTMHQLVATTFVRRQLYTNKLKDLIEDKSWGIRALCYTNDGSKIIAGFGHPDDNCLHDQKLIVVVNAKTLDSLWTDTTLNAQVNFIEVPLTPDTVPNEKSHQNTFKVLISTQDSLLKIAFIDKGLYLTGKI